PRRASARPDPRVDADDAAVQGGVGDAPEAGLLHRALELARTRKPGHRVGQITIGRLASRDPSADARQDGEEVVAIDLPEKPRRGCRELQYTDASSGP